MGTNRETRPSERKDERRRFGRFAARMPLRAFREEASGEARRGKGSATRLRLRDFSLGGLRLESPRPLKVHERVTVSLPPGGRHSPVHLTGRVVHCRPRADRYEVGIQFHDRERGLRRSPYVGLPRLFSMAAEFGGTLQPVSNEHERP